MGSDRFVTILGVKHQHPEPLISRTGVGLNAVGRGIPSSILQHSLLEQHRSPRLRGSQDLQHGKSDNPPIAASALHTVTVEKFVEEA